LQEQRDNLHIVYILTTAPSQEASGNHKRQIIGVVKNEPPWDASLVRHHASDRFFASTLFHLLNGFSRTRMEEALIDEPFSEDQRYCPGDPDATGVGWCQGSRAT
jgi:hypothetical protein